MVDVVTPFPWPYQLTFFAEHGSWQEGPEVNITEYPVEVGPPKRRRRSYIPSTQLRFNRIISKEDLDIFLDFFNNDLQSGVYNFTAVDPRTGESTEYQFMQAPTWRDVTTNSETTYWRLDFTLRRVNLPP